jgi:DNA-binding transcriptional MerR regulator
VDPRFRIGEVARRTGLSPDLLRAWERRYGVPRPLRTEGGLRLYPVEEVERLSRMRALVDGGLAPAEAARAVAVTAPQPGRPPLRELMAALGEALERFDEGSAHAAIDRLLASFGLETVLAEALLPTLRRLGDRWASGAITVAQEHFAASLIRGRLLGLARGWGDGAGPLALLACPEQELHDLALLIFGIALWRRGWRIVFLGADTPVGTLAGTADELGPGAVVLATTVAPIPPRDAAVLRSLGRRHPLHLAGPLAEALAPRVGGSVLRGDPIEAARALAPARPGRRRQG